MNTLSIRLVALVALAAVGCSTTKNPSKAYVGLFGDNSVAVIDTSTSKVLTTIPVTAPDGLVITPDGAKVYVSSNTTGIIDVIDTTTDAVSKSITVGTAAALPAGLAITQDGKHIVAAIQGDGKAAIIDTTTDEVVNSLAVGKAHNSAISEDGLTAYIASQVATAPAIYLVSIPSAAAGATYTLDKSPRALAAVGGKLYVTVASFDSVEVLDAATGRPGTQIPTGGSPHDIRPTIDGKRVLTVSQTMGDLEIIDPATGTITGRVPTGKMPHWIALSSDGKLAYVTNEGDNNMVAIDLATQKVTKTISNIGAAPRKIALQP